MVIQAIVDIDVDFDFGLTRAIKICNNCGLQRFISDSIKRLIHTVILDDIESKIRCLSCIKGFFTVDIRLLQKLCSLDTNIIKILELVPLPKAITKRIIGYSYIGNKIYIVEKTSKNNIIMIRILNLKTMPLVLEPSFYLIRAPNSEIVDKVLEVFRLLKIIEYNFTNKAITICK